MARIVIELSDRNKALVLALQEVARVVTAIEERGSEIEAEIQLVRGL